MTDRHIISPFGKGFGLLLLCLIALSFPGAGRGESLDVQLQPVDFLGQGAGSDQVGRLTFLSAFALESPDPRFGGLSGLFLRRQGTQLFAVSDKGWLVTARVERDEKGAVLSLRDASLGPLYDSKANSLGGRKSLGDAEALTMDARGHAYVSYERLHRIYHLEPGQLGRRHKARLLWTRGRLPAMPANGGLEAMTLLQDGRLLAFSEDKLREDGHHLGLLLSDGTIREFSYQSPVRFKPVDAATLPNGDVLVLERRFIPPFSVTSRIARINGKDIGEELIIGEEMARWGFSRIADNFEGLAVSRIANRTIIDVVSDDNYSALQRTYLLTFELTE